MRKVIKKLSTAVLAIIIGIFLCSCGNKNNGINSDPLRTDAAPITSRFSEFSTARAFFWKGGILGDARVPGPSTYYIKGFVVLTDEDKKSINEKYDFVKTEVQFEKSMEPNVTGFSEFEWTENEEFTESILGLTFGGAVYFDAVNGIVYLDVVFE